MSETATHSHEWAEQERNRCDDGHELIVSTCPCGAWEQTWPETGERVYLAPDDAGIEASVTHHLAALFALSKNVLIRTMVRRAFEARAAERETDSALN